MSLITAPILQCPVNAAPGSIANFLVTKSPVSFAVPLTFLALLVNDFRKLINVIVIIISGLVATFGFNYVPYKAYVIVAGVTALLTAAILTKLNKKNE